MQLLALRATYTTNNTILYLHYLLNKQLLAINLVLFTGFDRTPINFLLLNLAVADMTVAIFLGPVYIFGHTFTHPDGMTGTILCKLITGESFAWFGSAASVFTLVAIAIERYYTVIYPHGNKWKLTNRKLKVR